MTSILIYINKYKMLYLLFNNSKERNKTLFYQQALTNVLMLEIKFMKIVFIAKPINFFFKISNEVGRNKMNYFLAIRTSAILSCPMGGGVWSNLRTLG